MPTDLWKFARYGVMRTFCWDKLSTLMEKYIFAEKRFAEETDTDKAEKAKKDMEKAKRKWISSMRCRLNVFNKTKKNIVKFDYRVLESMFNQQRSAQYIKMKNDRMLNYHDIIQLKF